MSKIRVIMQTSEDGEFEAVIFTDDFKSKLTEFKYPQSWTISEDTADLNLPRGFPLNYQLIRE